MHSYIISVFFIILSKNPHGCLFPVESESAPKNILFSAGILRRWFLCLSYHSALELGELVTIYFFSQSGSLLNHHKIHSVSWVTQFCPHNRDMYFRIGGYRLEKTRGRLFQYMITLAGLLYTPRWKYSTLPIVVGEIDWTCRDVEFTSLIIETSLLIFHQWLETPYGLFSIKKKMISWHF